MLKTEKSTNLTGRSIVTDENGNEIEVMYLSANISKGSMPSTSSTIRDKSLYIKHKKECRQDANDFDDMRDTILEEMELEDEN